MNPVHADLSSVATSIDELTRRVARAAEQLEGTDRAGSAADLYEVERALAAARRRLDRTLRDLG